MKSRTLPTGIRQTPYGWQVIARRDGKYLSKRFPPETSIETLKKEREKLTGRHALNLPQLGQKTFRTEAVNDYLPLVKGMPTYTDREYRIMRWVDVFGDRVRSEITALEIRKVLEDWRVRGSHDGKPLSNASLNQRRTALMHLYTTLDGKSAANIVKDVPAYDERDSEQIRAQPMVVCAQLIKRLRHWSKMRARLHVLMWTGWPHQLLKQIAATDIDWKRSRVRLARRKKGKGMPSVWVPVTPRGMLALRRFDQLDCYGDFSNSALHSALARAAQQTPRLPMIRPYDLRHSFGTWAAERVKDDRVLKELLRTHSIERYTHGALQQRLDQAQTALSE